jgi:hypothetical protein
MQRLSTLLLGCDGFATPVKSPKQLGFYLLALNGPLLQRSGALEIH